MTMFDENGKRIVVKDEKKDDQKSDVKDAKKETE